MKIVLDLDYGRTRQILFEDCLVIATGSLKWWKPKIILTRHQLEDQAEQKEGSCDESI